MNQFERIGHYCNKCGNVVCKCAEIEEKRKIITSSNVNYFHVKEQTKEEKIAMYMECSKEQLIEMLLENQRINEMFIKPKYSGNFNKIIEDINNKLDK